MAAPRSVGAVPKVGVDSGGGCRFELAELLDRCSCRSSRVRLVASSPCSCLQNKGFQLADHGSDAHKVGCSVELPSLHKRGFQLFRLLRSSRPAVAARACGPMPDIAIERQLSAQAADAFRTSL